MVEEVFLIQGPLEALGRSSAQARPRRQSIAASGLRVHWSQSTQRVQIPNSSLPPNTKPPHPLIIRPPLCYILVLYGGDLVLGGRDY